MENTLITNNQNTFDLFEISEDTSKQNSLMTRRSYKIKILVDALRMVSEDFDISKETLIIPDECEKYGFVEGKHNLGTLLHFLADMLEE